jgi:Carboxypeptidase regulatory-like domain
MTTRSKSSQLLLACLSFALLAGAQKQAEPHAVVAGTVFRDPGLALPGATVVLLRRDDPKAKKLQEAISNYRGEFAFQVPVKPEVYVVRATLKGFHPAEKEATVSGEGRMEATLVLVPESKK